MNKFEKKISNMTEDELIDKHIDLLHQISYTSKMIKTAQIDLDKAFVELDEVDTYMEMNESKQSTSGLN